MLDAKELSKYLVEEEPAANLDEVEFLDDVPAEDYEDYEDYEAAPPRRSRPRAAPVDDLQDYDDYADEYDDYADDEYGGYRDEFTFVPAPVQRSRAKSGVKTWKFVRAGFLIVAIASCVYAGSMLLRLVGEGLSEIGALRAMAASVRPTGGVVDRQEAFDRLERASGGLKMAETGIKIIRISHFVAFPALLATVVGCVFFLIGPNRHGTLALAIAALSLAAVYLALVMIFQFIPAVGERWERNLYDRAKYVIGAGGADADEELVAMFIDYVQAALFLLVALFMAAVARAKKDSERRNSSMVIVWITAGLGGALLLLYTLLFVEWDLRGTDGPNLAPFLICWMANWVCNGLLVAILVLYIKGLFSSFNYT